MEQREGRPSEREYECLSAMQKSIRRGLELDAGRFFFELAEGRWAYMAINRLMVIAHEDVGTGDMLSALFALRGVDDARDMYKSGNGGWRLAASNAILALCRARKSRQSDHFQAVVRGRNVDSMPQIPDWALDKHTTRGRAMGRGVAHFRDVGTKLDREAGEDPYREEAFAAWGSNKLSRPPAGPQMNLFDG